MPYLEEWVSQQETYSCGMIIGNTGQRPPHCMLPLIDLHEPVKKPGCLPPVCNISAWLLPINPSKATTSVTVHTSSPPGQLRDTYVSNKPCPNWSLDQLGDGTPLAHTPLASLSTGRSWSGVPQIESWNVRVMTSSCCSRVRRWKCTA